MVIYIDSDSIDDVTDQKSTPKCCFSLNLTTMSWFSQKQNSATLIYAKDEYMEASQATCEAIWIHKLLVGLFGQELRPTMIYCDN